ncbi:hypothetical protein ACLB2K_009327 [Fragaria x ananassa]
MDSLVSNSALMTFFATTAASSDGINGIYQCRGDLSPDECNTCVSKIPSLVTRFCGQTSVAVRVQLRGWLLYTGSYDTVGVSGQCEGSLANQDCLACLQSASQKAKTECGDSISGQIYLNKCYISYNTSSNGNANGVPYSRKVGAGSGSEMGLNKVAIIFGIPVVFVCLVVSFLCSLEYWRRHPR